MIATTITVVVIIVLYDVLKTVIEDWLESKKNDKS